MLEPKQERQLKRYYRDGFSVTELAVMYEIQIYHVEVLLGLVKPCAHLECNMELVTV